MTSSSERPIFSVVIPVFNRTDPLRRALASLIAQDLPDFEVWVVDDGSEASIAAEIEAIIRELQDPRFQLIAYRQNRNGAYARNQGIQAATGRYISFLDSDDEWMPAKLTACHAFIQQHASCKLFYHRYANVRNNTPESSLPVEPICAGQSAAEYSFCTNRYGGIQSSCITVEAQHAKAVLFNDQLRGHQDWDFVLRASATIGDIGFIPDTLTWRHIADGNVGMVSRNLNYQFSREFLLNYRQYFSLKATAAYAAYVLTPKRLKTWPMPAFDWFQLLACCCHPRHCYQQYRQLRQLQSRCNRLLQYCLKNNICDIALVGFNAYTEFFLGHYGNKFTNITVIDKSKRGTTVYGDCCRLEELQAEQWTRIELLVAMTDHHFVSMQRDLRPYTSKSETMYAF